MSAKKSQIWSIDLLAAAAVFFVALFLFYQYFSNYSSQEGGSIKDLLQTSKTVSDHLVGPGYPEGWNDTAVMRIGLTDDNQRINETKVQYFSQMEYNESKKVLGTTYDFLVFFYDSEGNPSSINGVSSIGKPGVSKDNVYDVEEPEKLITISRFLIYDSSVYRMVVYFW